MASRNEGSFRKRLGPSQDRWRARQEELERPHPRLATARSEYAEAG
jgi:hypothetical protein